MARYKTVYGIEVTHGGLNKYRHIRGSDKYVVEQKARMLKAQWDEEWARKQEKEQQQLNKQRQAQQNLHEKEHLFQAKEDRRLNAEQRTLEAQTSLRQLQETLLYTLNIDDTINWEQLKDKSPYPESKPLKPVQPALTLFPIPPEPNSNEIDYLPKLNWICYLSKSQKIARIKEAQQRYQQAHQEWLTTKQNIAIQNQKKQEQHLHEMQRLEQIYRDALSDYETAKAFFKAEQQNNNSLIDQQKARYLAGDSGAVIDYCETVLSNSIYPDTFPQDFDLDYNATTKILIVEYQLPTLQHLPTIKEVRYLKSKDEVQEIFFSEKEQTKLYDDLIYQITLRSLHELFEADQTNALDSIIFNGFVTSIDKTHGNETTACIVSIQVSKDEFMAIKLNQVDPKACFKSLKGVGSSQLHSLTPIPPILQIDRSDRRFVNSYSVTAAMDDSTNLAAMPWEDFEHLIRELFEKEFSKNGGECRVTRASRDGGVDAIAFDPDPIRGGKVVIQAKRYTKTVSVSAVRDLYGTVVNEGATKGILVTTADYGPDSYEFARGKPITLLNGANLLHLLAAHGHSARINLQEARLL
jgi:restriction system protein